MIARFLHFTKLSTSGRNDELTSTCEMPFLEVSYLSPAPHYVQVSGNQRLSSIQASSLRDLRHAKSAPCFFEAAGSFQESAIPLTQIWLEIVLDKHRVISRDWQTTYSKISSGNIRVRSVSEAGRSKLFCAQIGIKQLFSLNTTDALI